MSRLTALLLPTALILCTLITGCATKTYMQTSQIGYYRPKGDTGTQWTIQFKDAFTFDQFSGEQHHRFDLYINSELVPDEGTFDNWQANYRGLKVAGNCQIINTKIRYPKCNLYIDGDSVGVFNVNN